MSDDRFNILRRDENRLLVSFNRAIGDPIYIKSGSIYLASSKTDFSACYAALVEGLRKNIVQEIGAEVFVHSMAYEISDRGERATLVAKCFKRGS